MAATPDKRTTDLEDAMYEHCQTVRTFLTKRVLGQSEYRDMMAALMMAIRLYENKKFNTRRGV